MTDRQKQFEAELKEFPNSVRDILQTIPLQAGRLSAQQCADLIKGLGINPEALMVRLLPLATIYADAPVSQFRVGAVAMAGEQGAQDQAGPFDLFLGANMDFMHQPLNQTIHAEQSATLNAWHQGAQYLQAIATSEVPCGHCRQFLYEFEKNAEIMVITPDRQNRTYRKTLLSDLLPEAFGPLNLGNRSGLMSPAPQSRKLQLKAAAKDPIINEALSSAEKSYAPYTQNFAGCALETQTGEIYSGRYVESAAYNPSLTPLHSAILCLNMATFEKKRSIQRVVLVEKPTAVHQRKVVELLLESWAPGIKLEYYEVI
jgi:cytidine deaminase